MGEHTVTSFDDDLGHIDQLIRDMGDLAGAMVAAATRSLLQNDTALAQLKQRWRQRQAQLAPNV